MIPDLNPKKNISYIFTSIKIAAAHTIYTALSLTNKQLCRYPKAFPLRQRKAVALPLNSRTVLEELFKKMNDCTVFDPDYADYGMFKEHRATEYTYQSGLLVKKGQGLWLGRHAKYKAAYSEANDARLFIKPPDLTRDHCHTVIFDTYQKQAKLRLAYGDCYLERDRRVLCVFSNDVVVDHLKLGSTNTHRDHDAKKISSGMLMATAVLLAFVFTFMLVGRLRFWNQYVERHRDKVRKKKHETAKKERAANKALIAAAAARRVSNQKVWKDDDSADIVI